jgi:hypothetical protein
LGAEKPSQTVVTGTPLFAAVSVMAGMTNTLSSDLESLFYTLADIGKDAFGTCVLKPSLAMQQQ